MSTNVKATTNAGAFGAADGACPLFGMIMTIITITTGKPGASG